MKALTRFTLFIIICGCCLAHVRSAEAQVAVIVHKENNVQNISLQELQDIYLCQKTAWSPRHKISVVSLNYRSSVFEVFFESGLGIKQSQLRRAWIQLALSGKADPPTVLKSQNEVIEFVAQNESAVGFVSLDQVSDDVKIVQVEGKGPQDAGYIFRLQNK